MPSRELRQETPQHGQVRFWLLPDGPISETDASSELTAIVIATDPALDHSTGRLVPGKRRSDVTTSLFLMVPDAAGISHLAGIICAEAQAVVVAAHAEKKGYRVVKDE